MENNVLELAKAIAEAYINGYKDGLKETAPKTEVLPEVSPEVTAEPDRAKYYVRKHEHRKVGYTKRGKPTTLVDENNRKYTFKSLRDANYFLGRGDCYISTSISRNKPIYDIKGNEYLIDEEEVG